MQADNTYFIQFLFSSRSNSWKKLVQIQNNKWRMLNEKEGFWGNGEKACLIMNMESKIYLTTISTIHPF